MLLEMLLGQNICSSMKRIMDIDGNTSFPCACLVSPDNGIIGDERKRIRSMGLKSGFGYSEQMIGFRFVQENTQIVNLI